MPLPHVTPFSKTPIYFTACTANRRRLLANETSRACLQAIWENSATLDGWFVGRYLLMPDHVHLFASPARAAKNRADWVKLWKSISARRLGKELHVTPPVWKPDTFDHILRGAESYSEKWEYVCANPVRAGLAIKTSDWPWQGEIQPLRF